MLQIKQLRKQNNLTMKQLGEKIGVSESTVSLYESGKRQPDYNTLKKLANYFNVSIDYLLGDAIDSDKIKTARTIARKLYEEQGVTISKIEEYLETNFATFKSWVDGYGDYFNSAENLSKLSNFFEVSLDYLLTGEEKSSPETEELENIISYHRDGKTVRKQLSKKQMDAIHTIIETMKESDEDL